MQFLFLFGNRNIIFTGQIQHGISFPIPVLVLAARRAPQTGRRVKVFNQFFRRPHGENSERTDALAVAMPPNPSTLEMLCNIVSMNPIPDGTQGTCI
jgi:hypothetical protein